jgi:hypothetical protein
VIDDEVTETLRELVDLIGATTARIVLEDDTATRLGIPARTLPLGGGEYLRVELPTHSANTDVEAALERTTRSLRSIRRRWEADRLPPIVVTNVGTLPGNGKVQERIEAYLRALSAIDRVGNAFVTRGTELIASAREPDELEGTRWPFLARRVLAVHAPNSSHGEVVDPDAFAMTFWYDAVLVVLLAEPYAIDFVRHRCRQVARELCNLLPLLEPDPDAPAAIGPRNRAPTQQ